MENLNNKNKPLLNPIKVGCNKIRNRFVMAPLTRCRAYDINGIPNDLHIKYYTERAKDAGFIISECSSVSLRGNAFPRSCGIFSKDQVEGWKKVCDSVHSVDGKIFLQIWHCGRSGIKDVLGDKPLGPSNIKNRHAARSNNKWVDHDEPEELTEEQIEELVNLFKLGAKNALEAGFDGVELHAANGYLIDNFLRDGSNKRTDKYGGSIENRCRFPLMVMDALIEVFTPEKVGIKITPVGRFNDMFDSDPIQLYKYFLGELNKRLIAFVELTRAPDHRPVPNYYGIKSEDQIQDVYAEFRASFNGVLIGNNGFTFDEAEKYIQENKFDMISFGRPFISNPDLVLRYTNNWPLTPANEKLFYTPGKEGYIDYPHF